MWKVYLSRFINVYLFNGSADEMLSSRMHREHWIIEPLVDQIFFWQYKHCRRSHKWEVSYNAQTVQETTGVTEEAASPQQATEDGGPELLQGHRPAI